LQPSELEGLLNAHAFLRVERPPELWAPNADLEPFVRLLGEMISAALVRNGGLLGEVILNVANVTVEPDAGAVPPGDFVSVTIKSAGDWSPESTWLPDAGGGPDLIGADLDAAARTAGAVYGYARVLDGGTGSVTLFFERVSPGSQ